jgi:hypothetical protein
MHNDHPGDRKIVAVVQRLLCTLTWRQNSSRCRQVAVNLRTLHLAVHINNFFTDLFFNFFSVAKATPIDFPPWKVVRTHANTTHYWSRPNGDALCPRRPEVHSAPRKRQNGSSTQRPKAVGLLSSRVVTEMRIHSIVSRNARNLVRTHFRRKLKLSPRFGNKTKVCVDDLN